MRAALIVVVAACGSSAGAGEPAGDAAITVGGDAPMVGDDAPSDAPVASACFPAVPGKPHPDYDQFHPVLDPQCAGTNHQQISGVERVVFLGDSITTGTPPTSPTDFYRTLVAKRMVETYGLIDIQDCSKWGAHDTDLAGQIAQCFGDVEPRKTLVVMTMGGNDMASIAKDANAGDTATQTMAKVDESLHALDDAVSWLRDPAHLPNGSYVVFSNIYEFTDATGDLASCPAAALSGFDTTAAPQMEHAYLYVAEQYMRIAVDHQVDMVFALENFCGHGYHSDDPASPCYRGPDTPRWFDLTCIHPNPTGHAALAGLFETTIAE